MRLDTRSVTEATVGLPGVCRAMAVFTLTMGPHSVWRDNLRLREGVRRASTACRGREEPVPESGEPLHRLRLLFSGGIRRTVLSSTGIIPSRRAVYLFAR